MNMFRNTKQWSERKTLRLILVLAGAVVLPAFCAFGQLDLPPLPGNLPPLKNAIQRPSLTGLIYSTKSVSEGYVLIAPQATTDTYLINNNGNVVHQWDSDMVTAMTAYLLPNGNLLRTARKSFEEIGNTVQELNWDGEVVWEYTINSPDQLLHHDIERLPNGNTLITVWEKKTKAEYVAAGRNPDTVPDDILWSDAIYEVKPTGKHTGEVVWRWSAWDHLVQDFDATKANYGGPAKHPECIDLNQVRTASKKMSDWLHINSVTYNPDRDELLLSSHGFSEIWVVSRKTGELVFRMGNPERYGTGGEKDRILFGQHDAHWIGDGLRGAGDILLFNNQNPVPPGVQSYSSVLELKPPLTDSGAWPPRMKDGAYPPCKIVWEYAGSPKTRFYSSNISGVQRLKNGGTLICSGLFGQIFELDANGDRVWEYVNPIFPTGPKLKKLEAWNTLPAGAENCLFRAYKYTPDYPAFKGKDLSPGELLGKSGVDSEASPSSAP